MNLPPLAEITSESLTNSLVLLREVQRIDDVHFLWMLAEVERRKYFLELSHSSIWAFCIKDLKLTSSAAGRRIAAARLLARFPAAAAYLADGRLGLTTFGMLHETLTQENHLRVLEEASGKCERDIDRLVATYVARDFVAERVRPAVPRTVTVQVSARPNEPNEAPTPLELVTVVLPTPPARIRAVQDQYIEVTITLRREVMDDLAQVTDALSHIVPGRRIEDVIHECIRRTLREAEARRGGLPARTTAASASELARPSTPAPGVLAAPVNDSCTPAPGVLAAPVNDSSTPAPGVLTAPVNDSCTPAPGVLAALGNDSCTPAPGVPAALGNDSCTPAPGVLAALGNDSSWSCPGSVERSRLRCG